MDNKYLPIIIADIRYTTSFKFYLSLFNLNSFTANFLIMITNIKKILVTDILLLLIADAYFLGQYSRYREPI